MPQEIKDEEDFEEDAQEVALIYSNGFAPGFAG